MDWHSGFEKIIWVSPGVHCVETNSFPQFMYFFPLIKKALKAITYNTKRVKIGDALIPVNAQLLLQQPSPWMA